MTDKISLGNVSYLGGKHGEVGSQADIDFVAPRDCSPTV